MIGNLIDKNIVSEKKGSTVVSASKLMAEKNVGCLVILDGETPSGIITDRDIVVRCLAKGLDPHSTTVEKVMSPAQGFVNERDGVFDCIKKMNEMKVRRIIVVDSNKRAIGIVSFGDIAAMLSKEFYELTRHTTSAEEWEKSGSGRKVA